MQQEMFDQETTNLIEQEAELLKQMFRMEHQLFLMKQKQIKLKAKIRRKLRSNSMQENTQENRVSSFQRIGDDSLETFEKKDYSKDYDTQEHIEPKV